MTEREKALQEFKYFKEMGYGHADLPSSGSIELAIAALESPRDWTPCAEGLPEDDDRFCAWMQLEATINTNGRLATRTVGRFHSPTLKKWFWADGWTGYPTEDGKGIEDANIGNVVAWRYPTPYRADDTTGKAKEDA